MKIIAEIEIEGEIDFKKDTPKERIIKTLDNVICDKLNALVLDASLDHSEFIPDHKNKRWVDYIGNIKAIGVLL